MTTYQGKPWSLWRGLEIGIKSSYNGTISRYFLVLKVMWSKNSGRGAKGRLAVALVAFSMVLSSQVNFSSAQAEKGDPLGAEETQKEKNSQDAMGSQRSQKPQELTETQEEKAHKTETNGSKSSAAAGSAVLKAKPVSGRVKPSGDTESVKGFTPKNFTLCEEEQLPTNPLIRQNEAVDHFECARFYMSKWDTALAEVELRAAIMYMPQMKAAHRDYCVVALMRGKPLRALAEFSMVVGLGEAIPLTEAQQKQLREEASGLHYNKGLEYARKDNWQEAISELLWSEKYTPLDPAVHRSLAFAYASNNEFDRAEQYYNFALSLDPDDAMALADYSVVLSDKGETAKALEKMARAVQLKPDAVALHVDLGFVAEQKGDFETAAKEFRYAVSKNPDQPMLWNHLANALEKLGRHEEAQKALRKGDSPL